MLECVFVKFIDGAAGSGMITTWERIRCNGSHLRNFADVGTFIWYSPKSLRIGDVRGVCLGRVVFIGRWRGHDAVVVIQRCDVTAASSAESGPNSSMRARRVILVDEFDAISDAECHDSFRCACVHHDCVRSTAQLGHCRIHTDQEGVLGVAHQDDRNFFLNPGWHSVNKW